MLFTGRPVVVMAAMRMMFPGDVKTQMRFRYIREAA
jgi:hypothetical protein